MQNTQLENPQWGMSIVSRLLALVLALSLPALSACAGSGTGESGSDAGEAAVDAGATSSDETTDDQEGEAIDAEDEDGVPAIEEVPYEWPDECTDRRGDISVYALCELNGVELDTLLEQQDYVWSSRDQMWLKGNGSAALVACGPSTSYLTREQMQDLGRVVDEAGVSYRIVTSRYSNPRRAFDGVAGRVMTIEDVEYTDLGVVGVVQGVDLETRALVVVTEGNEVMVVSVFGERALAAGMLDEMVGRKLGSTIDAAFETLAGRPITIASEE